MSYDTMPIVGGFYHPPAKLIMESIPVGTPLFLTPEPDNQFDPNAVAVWIVTSDIPASAHLKLEVELPNHGFDLDSFLAQEQWHLGYIPKALAAELRAQDVVPLDTVFDVHFNLSNSGKPEVRFPSPVL